MAGPVGIFVWHDNARYYRDEAVREFAHEKAAKKYIEKNDPGGAKGYVIRELAYVLPTRNNPQALPVTFNVPKKALALGKIVAIIYESAKDGAHYRHDFRSNSRPHLAVSPDGKQLLILGGGYRVTDRGIEDK